MEGKSIQASSQTQSPYPTSNQAGGGSDSQLLTKALYHLGLFAVGLVITIGIYDLFERFIIGDREEESEEKGLT
jgi:hypothetical protein